jgi:ketosteroid isomerase-like protein
MKSGSLDRFVEHDKKHKGHSISTGSDPQPAPESAGTSDLEEFFRSLKPETRRPKPNSDAVAAAVEAAQRLAAEAEAEEASEGAAQNLSDDSFDHPANDGAAVACAVCGYRNRGVNKFCGMCGVAMNSTEMKSTEMKSTQGKSGTTVEASVARPTSSHPKAGDDRPGEPETRAAVRPSPEFHQERHANGHPETHHYHHHYHHHYFQGGNEGIGPNMSGGMGSGMTAANLPRPSEPARDVDRFRPTAALRGDMSRAEAAVRRIAHEWVLACNTKHLDDLLELYIADAMVLRSNFPPVRGAAAVREFFFGALDAGLGEVELEPLRVDIAGDLAYEAGRCKALVPSATGKRREERGKYLWVFARQTGGEWKLATDCWSSDLTLTTLESDVPQGAPVKSTQPRKS